jgi:hypothetical protein
MRTEIRSQYLEEKDHLGDRLAKRVILEVDIRDWFEVDEDKD